MLLREYQTRALESIHVYFEANRGNPLVVAPTGSGKSVIIGAFCKSILETWREQRILVLTHVRELIEQDYLKLKTLWPSAPAGIYCAGLGQKRPRDPVTFASIQSVYRKAHVLGWRDLVLVDEAHLLGTESDSMYRKLIADLRAINPRMKVIGFTATPYRLRTGMLTEGPHRIFTDVAFEVTIAELLDAGHIAPLISKASVVQADLSSVRITAGEYNAADLERELDRDALTRAALEEVFRLAGDRRSWLVFCSGVRHAEHVRDAIRERGLTAEMVSGDTPPGERDAILAGLKNGTVQAVTNCGVLTTGFDAPNIDLIVLLRATTSPGLYLQMLGRGMRTHSGKANCLVLDYAGNIETHGPVTHVKPPRSAVKRGHRQGRNDPTCMICPKCRMANPLGSKECGDCGYEFQERERVKHGTEASVLEVMGAPEGRQAEWVAVDSIRYLRHEKPGKPDSLRVEYRCGLVKVSEWVCLSHPPGFALGKARDWWKARSDSPPPGTIGSAIESSAGLPVPSRIRIRKNGQYWEILGYDWNENEPAREDAVAVGNGAFA